jgi:hypothetical protein
MSQAFTITASLNGSSVSAQVMVLAAEVDQVTVAPSNPTAFAGDILAFTATALMTDVHEYRGGDGGEHGAGDRLGGRQ